MDNQGEDVGVVVFTAGQAAQQLEVSSSGLRRLANAYEAVFGELPRDPGTQARGYPEEAIERLRAARRGVETGQYKSTQAALGALKRGVPVDAGEMAGRQDAAAQDATGQALRVLTAEMQAMRAEIERLRLAVEERDRAQLPPTANAERIDQALAAELREDSAPPERPPMTPESDTTAERPGAPDGLLVRAARWLERRLRR